MSTLNICREIEKIEVIDNVANIYFQDDKVKEAFMNERIKSDVDEFMKKQGLSIKIIDKQKDINPEDKLKEIFGDKLIIK